MRGCQERLLQGARCDNEGACSCRAVVFILGVSAVDLLYEVAKVMSYAAICAVIGEGPKMEVKVERNQ